MKILYYYIILSFITTTLFAKDIRNIFFHTPYLNGVDKNDETIKYNADFNRDGILDSITVDGCNVSIKMSGSKSITTSLEDQCGECTEVKVTQEPAYFFIGFFGTDNGDIYAYRYDKEQKNWFLEGMISKSKENKRIVFDKTLFPKQWSIDKSAVIEPKEDISHMSVSRSIVKKQHLYKAPNKNSKTKMYLLEGDKVEVLEEKDDWFYIVYHGKKDIKAWIPKTAVDEQ
ncbi:SH3 domain-containing protein [Sulfurimonas sp. HSL3-2]|uniref:SH3 domain-containing protein n=1 Tax=Hydrocurvibacter mobilis TaxID=3131936 RepID=UPI0031F7DC83